MIDRHERIGLNMASLAEELRAAVGAANVLTAREACVAFECDGLTAYRLSLIHI